MTTGSLSVPFQPTGQAAMNGNPASGALHVGVMTITPDMAREWLARNTRAVEEQGRKFRHLRWPLVDAIVRDIIAGNFILNGETIKIAVDGVIVDGQHRLSAIVKAGKPVQSFVVEGLPPGAEDTVDTGAARKLADQLMLHGEKNTALLGAVTRWALLWEQGQRTRAGGAVKVTHSEALAFLELHPELREAAMFASHARQQFAPIRASVYGMTHWLLTPISQERADDFLGRLVSGENISAGDPAHTLRARFLSSTRMDERLNEHEQLALIMSAWNAGREARRLHRVQLPKGGLTQQNFPEPK